LLKENYNAAKEFSETAMDMDGFTEQKSTEPIRRISAGINSEQYSAKGLFANKR
jgi:hypothetical protein